MSNNTEESRSAEHHKNKGNNFFKRNDYDNAIREYTAAIKQNPRNPVYYTNRALCYLKLKKYDNVILDCETALEKDANSVKGHYMLGQALTEKKDFELAIVHLRKAYQLAIEGKVGGFLSEILQVLLNDRKRRWEQQEKERIQKESELLKYLKTLIISDRDRQLQKATPKNISTFSKFVGNYSQDVQDKLDHIYKSYDEKLSQIEQVFAQSDENLRPRQVPDYFLDKISFNIMHDPVVTSSGITYERAHLKEHFKKIGYFDPLSREHCTEDKLYPNLALKEAIEDFLNKNGWAADY
ncbi:16387_t:CDS:1 [Entrophospora sp. SA101]|nr:16387_t:CDS:1 [Entrophospora sp. SA101]CAJ0905260.1 6904_t:CDS:1 [Entrophospora sp. SA101]